MKFLKKRSLLFKIIIAILFRDYWATDAQREKILAKEKYDRVQLEKQKRKQYNSDDIFKKRKSGQIIEAIQHEDVADDTVLMVEYKENFFTKIINKIKSIFH